MQTLKQSPVDKPLQFNGLTDPVRPGELRAYRNDRLTSGQRKARALARIIGGVIGGVVPIVMLLIGVATSDTATAVVGGVWLLLGIGVVIASVFLQRHADRQSVRLWRFASDNDWQYTPFVRNPQYEGLIFTQGHSRKAHRIIRSPETPKTAGFEMGEYQYTVGSGKHQQTYRWLYCQVELERNVPHMVLDSTHNNPNLFGRSWASNLPATYDKNQVIELEGDFNEYFTLYAPVKYKRDAYYIFTPDLMALLIDNSQSFDVEIIDNHMYVYARLPAKGVSLLEPQFMRRLLKIVHTVGMSMHRRTDYYSDEYVADRSRDTVATPGRRLRKRLRWLPLLLVAGYIALQLLLSLGG